MNDSRFNRDAADNADSLFTRRHMFKTAAPAIGALGAAPALSAAVRQNQTVSVADFGATGDGVADDSGPFLRALASAQVIEVPPGVFRIAAPLVLRNGQLLRGAGHSGWEPYTGRGAPQSSTRTEIVIDRGLALDARNTNNAAIAGIAIRSREARQSEWGGEPGYQPGTTGINIGGALQFNATEVSFHGLEVGVESAADSGQSTQMPRIGNWIAHDCATVFRFVSNDQNFYAVRDARIDGCMAALHCGRIAEIRKCDGLRIENVRLFQCKTNSLLIEHTPFVAITGSSLFETGEEAIILRDCQYATMAGVQVARTGFYRTGRLIQKSGLLIENCADLSFEGLVEQPVGRAFTLRNCVNISINAAIGTPFWQTGSLGSSEGAVHIEGCRAVSINASFGGTSYWVAVWADAVSAGSINGRIATEGPAGVVRCTNLQAPPLSHVTRTSAAVLLAPGASVTLDQLRVLVPRGKSLVSRSIELTIADAAFAAGRQRSKPLPATEPGGGSLSLERMVLHTNDSTAARYAVIPIGIYNPTAEPVEVPAGHEIRLSLAIE